MTPSRLLRHAIEPALELLPEKMASDAARAMLLAIALQESRIKHRRQIHGPARGYWQFEVAGLLGVLHHGSVRVHILRAISALDYSALDASELHAALEHNDVLAAAVARCLLWTHPVRLPLLAEERMGWDQYIETWRPGRPHAATWERFYRRAWMEVHPRSRTIPLQT